MDKERIRQAILDRLSLEFETDQATSKRTRTASNDAETKSEGKYDTRSTEENYLADGLAKKALAAAEAAKVYRELPSGKFHPNQSIDVGALVELSIEGKRAWFFLGPAVGGIEIDVAGEVVTVITRGSLLGSQMVGKKAGDLISAPEARIESVQ